MYITVSNVPEEALDNGAIWVSYIDRAEEWKCLYRLDIKGQGGHDPALSLQMLGKLTNSTQKNWEGIEVNLVANCLEISQKLVEKTAPKEGLRRQQRGGMVQSQPPCIGSY